MIASCAQIRQTPNYWTPDVDAVACFVCRTPFSVMNRKHHCRKCGSVVCQSCSKTRLSVPEHGIAEPSRVCDECIHLTLRGGGGGMMGMNGEGGPSNGYGVEDAIDGIRALQHSRASSAAGTDSSAETVLALSSSSQLATAGGAPMVVKTLPSLGEAQANGLSISLLCDGCDKELGVINAVRYWCADCRDFELCEDCFGNVDHPHLRFIQWDGRAKTSSFMCASSSRREEDTTRSSSAPPLSSRRCGGVTVAGMFSSASSTSSPTAGGEGAKGKVAALFSKLDCRAGRRSSEGGEDGGSNSNGNGYGSRFNCSMPPRPSMPSCGRRDNANNDNNTNNNNNNNNTNGRLCFARRAPWEEGDQYHDDLNNEGNKKKWLSPPNCMKSRKETPLDTWDDSPSKRTFRPPTSTTSSSPNDGNHQNGSSSSAAPTTWIGTIKDKATCGRMRSKDGETEGVEDKPRGRCSVGGGSNTNEGGNAMFRTNCLAGRV